MPFRRRLFLIAVLGGLLLAYGVLGNGRSAYATAPNVVLFIADDLGWTDWQYDATSNPTGSKLYETPNLLRLANRGVQFTNAYTSAPICSPTRAAILTGKSPARTRITNYLPGTPNTTVNLKEPVGWQNFLPGDNVQPNLAKRLKNNGYATSYFGKWHLGSTAPDCACYGFDSNVGGSDAGSPDAAGGWFAGSDGMWAGLPGLNTPGQYPADKYLSDAITEQAGSYIQQHANPNQPFFLADFDYQVHTGLAAPQNLIDKYTAKINTLQSQGVDLKGQTNATYAAMVEKLDQDVGAVLDRLDDPNMDGDKHDSVLDNTVFIFSSDNGGEIEREGTSVGFPTRNLPLREGKGSLYEGGIRVPLIISYGNDANIAKGSRTAARTSSYDLFPTIMDFTGTPLPQNNTIDGVSIRSAIEGAAFDRGLLFWHYPHRSNQAALSPSYGNPALDGGSFVSAVADKDWKLIFFYEDRHYELYNDTADIGETTNLLAYNPAIAHDLSLALQNYLSSTNAMMPICNTTSPGNSAGCTTLNASVALPNVLAAPVPGDYNGDSIVNVADYNVWRSNFGSTTLLAADGNRNGVVDAADYAFWRAIYMGPGSGSSAGGFGGATVPEPTAALLFCMGLLSLVGTPRSRRPVSR